MTRRLPPEVVTRRQELTDKLIVHWDERERNDGFTDIDATRLWDALEQERDFIIEEPRVGDLQGFVAIAYIQSVLLSREIKRKKER